MPHSVTILRGSGRSGGDLPWEDLSSCPGLGSTDVDDSVVNAAPPGSVGKASTDCVFKSLFPSPPPHLISIPQAELLSLCLYDCVLCRE